MIMLIKQQWMIFSKRLLTTLQLLWQRTYIKNQEDVQMNTGTILWELLLRKNFYKLMFRFYISKVHLDVSNKHSNVWKQLLPLMSKPELKMLETSHRRLEMLRMLSKRKRNLKKWPRRRKREQGSMLSWRLWCQVQKIPLKKPNPKLKVNDWYHHFTLKLTFRNFITLHIWFL